MEKITQEQSRVCTLEVELFRLTDTDNGYEPENRTFLRTVDFGPIDEDDLETYEDKKFLSLIEPLFPLSVYNRDLIYREIMCLNYELLEEQLTHEGYPTQFMLLRKNSPLEDFIKQAAKETKKSIKDPDAPYFPMTGPGFVGVEERRLIERQNPYVYGEYKVRFSLGCHHKESGVFVKCMCNEFFGCEECHNESVLDHQAQVVGYSCRKCDAEFSDYRECCPECGFLLTVHFCEICKVYDKSDPEFMPYTHCPQCDCCHAKVSESIRRHCDGCGNCFNIEDFLTHHCSSEQLVCIVCSSRILPEEDSKRLACAKSHCLHASCYQALIDESNIRCPICRKLMLEEDSFVSYKLRMVEGLLQGKFDRIEPVLLYLECDDCQQQFYDVRMLFCHFCGSINISLIKEEVQTYEDVYGILCGNAVEEEYSEFEQYAEKYNDLFAGMKEFVLRVLAELHRSFEHVDVPDFE